MAVHRLVLRGVSDGVVAELYRPGDSDWTWSTWGATEREAIQRLRTSVGHAVFWQVSRLPRKTGKVVGHAS